MEFLSPWKKTLLEASDLIKKCHRIHCNLISSQQLMAYMNDREVYI